VVSGFVDDINMNIMKTQPAVMERGVFHGPLRIVRRTRGADYSADAVAFPDGIT